MLGTAQPFRLLGAKGCGDGSVRPGQAPLRRLVLRPVPRRRDRQQAAFAFDHHVAGIGGGRRDQRDVPRPVCRDALANELRPGARLAEAAAGEEQPDPPIARRRLLLVPRPQPPIEACLGDVLKTEALDQPVSCPFGQRGDPAHG